MMRHIATGLAICAVVFALGFVAGVHAKREAQRAVYSVTTNTVLKVDYEERYAAYLDGFVGGVHFMTERIKMGNGRIDLSAGVESHLSNSITAGIFKLACKYSSAVTNEVRR